MSHPYKKHAHKNDPKWYRGIEKYVEKANKSDIDSTVRNYGGDRKVNAKAGYEIAEQKRADGGAATFKERWGDMQQPGGKDAKDSAQNAISLGKGMINKASGMKKRGGKA